MKHAACLVTVFTLLATSPLVLADNVNVPSEPLIVVSGTAGTQITASNAKFTIEVRSDGSSSSAAGAENARLSKLVIEALRAASLRDSELSGSDLTVSPRWNYDDPLRRPKRLGYTANNQLRIETERLDKLGALIDAALNAGATGISDIEFTAKDSVAARQRELAEAVAHARTDAETIAKASGGRLGRLVLISAEQMGDSFGRNLNEVMVTGARRKDAVPTEIAPPQVSVNAHVIARWQFISDGVSR